MNALSPNGYDLSLVIACYNEESVFEDSLRCLIIPD